MTAPLQHPVKGVPVTFMPMIDPGSRRREVVAPRGRTLREIVAQVLPLASESLLERTRVVLVNENGQTIVGRQFWHVVRPRRGVHVVIRVVPGDPGTATALIGLLAQAAATQAAGVVGAALQLSPFAQGLLTLAFTAGAGLLVNLLTKKDEEEEKPTYAITAWKNEFAPSSPVPVVCGKIRYAPRFGAYSWLEVDGNDIYVRAIFLWGYGPLDISDIKIGDTSVDEYDEVE